MKSGRPFGPIAVEGEIAPTTIARLHLQALSQTLQPCITSLISAASSRTRSSSVSHEHMKRAPPLPMKV